MPQLCNFHMDLHPLIDVQLNIPMVDVLGNVACECHAKLQIKWESFAHEDQQKVTIV